MQINLGPFDKFVRALLAVFSVFAAVVLFEHPLAKLLAAAFAVLALVELITGKCHLLGRLGKPTPSDSVPAEAGYLLGLCAIQLVLAYEWWSGGFEKIVNPDYIGRMGGTIAAFASKNPFPWFKDFLEGFAAPNASLFGYAVSWGELVAGLVLMVSAAALLYLKDARQRRIALIAAVAALAAGMAMNAVFYLAAGWTGPGTKGINVVMFWTQAVLAYVWLTTLFSRKA